MAKLTTGQRNLLTLIRRDAQQEGWAIVSRVVMPVVVSLPSELVEVVQFDAGDGRVRLTEHGQHVVYAMAWL